MLKVIIADDEEKVCQLIYSLVDWETMNMEVVAIAHNGVECLELIELHQPDLVITDIRMPGYNGLEMISHAKEIKKDIEFIIISGYRHFEYAQSAIRYGVSDYLLKPINKKEFINILQKMYNKHKRKTEQLTNEERWKMRLESDIDKLRGGFFTEILLSRIEEITNFNIEKVNEEYHFSFKPGCFQILIVKLDIGFGNLYHNGMKLLEDKVVQILHNGLKPWCYEMEVFFEDSIAYCIINYGEENGKIIRKQCKVALNELIIQREVFEHLEITLGVGSVVWEMERIKESLTTAMAASAHRLIIGTGRLIENIVPTEEQLGESKIFADSRANLDGAFGILDKEAVISQLSIIKSNTDSMLNRNGEAILKIIKEIYRYYLFFLRSSDLMMDDMERLFQEFNRGADRCGSINQLFEYLSKLIGDSMDKIIEDKKQADMKPIRLAKQYIKENYMNPISLEEVSSEIGFNTSYFCSLFKKETGSNFLEYLSEVRIEKAKELLRNTNLKISSISIEVGYNDVKHFTKKFYTISGLKPNEYRKLYS